MAFYRLKCTLAPDRGSREQHQFPDKPHLYWHQSPSPDIRWFQRLGTHYRVRSLLPGSWPRCSWRAPIPSLSSFPCKMPTNVYSEVSCLVLRTGASSPATQPQCGRADRICLGPVLVWVADNPTCRVEHAVGTKLNTFIHRSKPALVVPQSIGRPSPSFKVCPEGRFCATARS